MKITRFSFLSALALLAITALPQAAQAQATIDTTPLWTGGRGAAWGIPNGPGNNFPSYGQSFTAPTGQTTLDTFSFNITSGKNGFSDTNYQAHLYAWNSGTRVITGSALWSSAVLNSGTVGGFTLFSFSPSVSVTPSTAYIFFLTTADVTQGGTPVGQGFFAELGASGAATDGYVGGGLFLNNNASFAGLSSTGWLGAENSGGAVGGDLSFTATFSSGAAAAPEPGTLALLALGGTLVIVKRRRK